MGEAPRWLRRRINLIALLSVALLFFSTSVTALPDSDGDGVSDENDEFPFDSTQNIDQDGDGFGDNSSGERADSCPSVYGTSMYGMIGCLDSDGDGWSNAEDAFPSNSQQWLDTDGDGFGDNAVGDFGDACPTEWNPTNHGCKESSMEEVTEKIQGEAGTATFNITLIVSFVIGIMLGTKTKNLFVSTEEENHSEQEGRSKEGNGGNLFSLIFIILLLSLLPPQILVSESNLQGSETSETSGRSITVQYTNEESVYAFDSESDADELTDMINFDFLYNLASDNASTEVVTVEINFTLADTNGVNVSKIILQNVTVGVEQNIVQDLLPWGPGDYTTTVTLYIQGEYDESTAMHYWHEEVIIVEQGPISQFDGELMFAEAFGVCDMTVIVNDELSEFWDNQNSASIVWAEPPFLVSDNTTYTSCLDWASDNYNITINLENYFQQFFVIEVYYNVNSGVTGYNFTFYDTVEPLDQVCTGLNGAYHSQPEPAHCHIEPPITMGVCDDVGGTWMGNMTCLEPEAPLGTDHSACVLQGGVWYASHECIFTNTTDQQQFVATDVTTLVGVNNEVTTEGKLVCEVEVIVPAARPDLSISLSGSPNSDMTYSSEEPLNINCTEWTPGVYHLLFNTSYIAGEYQLQMATIVIEDSSILALANSSSTTEQQSATTVKDAMIILVGLSLLITLASAMGMGFLHSKLSKGRDDYSGYVDAQNYLGNSRRKL